MKTGSFIRPPPLSPTEREKRKPPPPDSFVDALQDRLPEIQERPSVARPAQHLRVTEEDLEQLRDMENHSLVRLKRVHEIEKELFGG